MPPDIRIEKYKDVVLVPKYRHLQVEGLCNTVIGGKVNTSSVKTPPTPPLQTHEESVTDLVGQEVTSHHQLPLLLYQVSQLNI